MRATDSSETATAESLEALPTFDVDFFVDDREHPTRVMVMPRALERGSSNRWLSIDAQHAVPLDEVQ